MTPSLWNNHVPACSHNEIAPTTSRNLWGGEGWLCSEAAPMCRLWFSKAAVRPPTKENGNNMLISGPFHAPKTQAEPGIRACDCHMTRADGALTRLHEHSGIRAVPRAHSVGWAGHQFSVYWRTLCLDAKFKISKLSHRIRILYVWSSKSRRNKK